MQNHPLAHVCSTPIPFARGAALSLAHLSDTALLHDLASLVARDRATTATLLAHIAEVDARRLYVPAGYPSMHAYCVDELHLSEEAALRRIQAARATRRFPALSAALAEGRLHLTAVCLLAPHLTPENVDELIEASNHKRKFEIEQLLAQLFPVAAVPARLRAVTPLISDPQHSPANVECDASARVDARDEHSPANVDSSSGKVPPVAEECFLVQVRISKRAHEKLRHAQALLSHALPTGDVALVFERALDTLIVHLEKRKFGARGAREQVRDVLAGLRNLGCRADEARLAAAFANTQPDLTLEERMLAALVFLSRRSKPQNDPQRHPTGSSQRR